MKLGAYFLTEKEPTAQSMAYLALLLWLEKQGVQEFRYLAKALTSHLTPSSQTVSVNIEIKK